jgi:hypothetical protein
MYNVQIVHVVIYVQLVGVHKENLEENILEEYCNWVVAVI